MLKLIKLNILTIRRKTNLEEAGSKWNINTLVFSWSSENLEISNLSDSTRNKSGQEVNKTTLKPWGHVHVHEVALVMSQTNGLRGQQNKKQKQCHLHVQ